MKVSTRVLGPDDVAGMRAMLALFSRAFDDPASYASKPPSDDYLRGLLARDTFVAIGGYVDGTLAGGIAGYELPKFEQARSELYIYDLAVDAAHRRRGVATAMIETLKREASRRGAWVIYVQADHGDDAAVALYSKLGVREDVMHFDIAP